MTNALAPQDQSISERQLASIISQLQAIHSLKVSGAFQVRALDDVLQALHDRLVQNGISGELLGGLVADLAPYTDYGNGQPDSVVPLVRELYDAGAIHRHGLSAREARQVADRITEALEAIDGHNGLAIPTRAVTVTDAPQPPAPPPPPPPFTPRPFPSQQ
jgi:hypothetical protein